jgi:hypothetical protein
MRKGRKGMRWVTLAAFGACASLQAAAAQGTKSAEGAQQFLAAMVSQIKTRVSFVDEAGRSNFVTGRHRGTVKTNKGGVLGRKETITDLPEKIVDKQVTDVSASAIDAVDAYGRPTACATRITAVTAPPYDDSRSDVDDDTRTLTFKVTVTSQRWEYEPLAKFMSPAQVIDWSNAQISRTYDGSVTVTSKGQAYAKLHLTFVAGDVDLADRIEFAMKVLSMSCGNSMNARL